MSYILYDNTGNVTQVVDCPKNEIVNYNFSGYIETGEILNFTQYKYTVINGLLVKTAKVIDTRSQEVNNIVVTISTGKVFDGDEKSQERILRAINIATITGDTTTQWKMADNTVVDVTLEELKEALALAGKEMSRIWLE